MKQTKPIDWREIGIIRLAVRTWRVVLAQREMYSVGGGGVPRPAGGAVTNVRTLAPNTAPLFTPKKKLNT